MGSCSSTDQNIFDNNDSSILTSQDIKLVRNSWRLVVQYGLIEYGTEFMTRLFLKHRDLKNLWSFGRPLDTEDQMRKDSRLLMHGEKLFNSIDLAVNNLDDLNTLVPILIQLGYSHYKWGTRDQHFPIIGAVLIETLECGLQNAFNMSTKRAWIKVFGVVESQMKIGLRKAELES